MKKFTKLISFAMTVICALSLLCVFTPQEQVQAVTQTRNVTLVKGERITWENYSYNVTSCSSSKKSVATVKKNPDNSKGVIITCKGTGSATVKIKLKGGHLQKINVKVVGAKFTVKTISESENYVFFSVKNATKVFFDRLAIQYTLKNAEGEIVKQDMETVYRSTPGSTAYFSVWKGSDSNVDISQCTAKVIPLESRHDLNYTYTNQTKKIKVTDKLVDDELKIKWKNNCSEYISGVADVVFYDADGNVVNVENSLKSMDAKTIDTATVYISNYLEYDHYKIFVRAYSEKYKK